MNTHRILPALVAAAALTLSAGPAAADPLDFERYESCTTDEREPDGAASGTLHGTTADDGVSAIANDVYQDSGLARDGRDLDISDRTACGLWFVDESL